jgi:hypothetical protein
MNVTINRLKVFFLVVFAVAVVAIWAYQILWVWPAKACDKKGAWWDPQTRVCAAPIFIPDITGRPKGMSRGEWSERQAARKVEEEHMGVNAGISPAAPPAAPAVTAKPAPAPAPKAAEPAAK